MHCESSKRCVGMTTPPSWRGCLLVCVSVFFLIIHRADVKLSVGINEKFAATQLGASLKANFSVMVLQVLQHLSYFPFILCRRVRGL